MPSTFSPTTPVATAPSSLSALPAIAPRRSLPGSRAITGGLLVAVAAIATYIAAAGASGDHRQSVMVAAHDIAAGTQISAADLTPARMQLSADDSSHVALSRGRFAGATALGPIKRGELVQTGDLEFQANGPTQPEISIAIPAARALGGELRSGDTVDVVVTDKTSGDLTRTAVTDAKIVRVDQSNSSVGHDGDLTVTFAINSRDDANAIAAANDQGQITLVRTTGLAAANATANTATQIGTTTTTTPDTGLPAAGAQ